jgi:preprotein translocase subunit SecD
MSERRSAIRRLVVAVFAIVVAIVGGGALTACSSSSKRVVVPAPTTTSSTVHAVPHPGRESLQFREVERTIPYAGPTTATTARGIAATTCENGKRVTDPARDIANLRVVLADRVKTSCYVLGPVLLTVRNIERAQAVVKPTTAEWEINVHFANDDFVTKIAGPEVGRQVAVVLDHVVESAPTVNQGITGRDITISGGFDEATARSIARELS